MPAGARTNVGGSALARRVAGRVQARRLPRPAAVHLARAVAVPIANGAATTAVASGSAPIAACRRFGSRTSRLVPPARPLCARRCARIARWLPRPAAGRAGRTEAVPVANGAAIDAVAAGGAAPFRLAARESALLRANATVLARRRARDVAVRLSPVALRPVGPAVARSAPQRPLRS